MSEKRSFAINGFGRIGRTSFRIWWYQFRYKLDLVAINTSGSMDIEGWVQLLKHDTNYGYFDPGLSFKQHQSYKETSDEDPLLGTLFVDGKPIAVTAQKDPAKINWRQLGAEIVLEATGKFLTKDTAELHLQGGAKQVLLTAPAKSKEISTSVIGVNKFNTKEQIHSNASCTTNCIAPIVKIINDHLGIKKALLTTIHAYTDDQNLLDNSHKKDLRRARGAACNLVPTSTGAAKATTEIIPDLRGVFDGLAIRVPTPVGSLSDIVMVTKKKTSKEEINEILTKAAHSRAYQGILAVSDEPIVSSDIVGRSESSIVDLPLTQVIDGDLVKIVAWYDNEWGYCARLLDQLLCLP